MRMLDRILSRTIPEPNTGCWIWEGGISQTGYGIISKEGKSESVHREIYRLLVDEDIEGKVILHTCDNRWCVNPKHLVAGTQGDNIKDMVSKQRQARGEGQGLSKLSIENVLFIKKHIGKISLQKLADMFGVDKSTVSCIKTNKTWRHV